VDLLFGGRLFPYKFGPFELRAFAFCGMGDLASREHVADHSKWCTGDFGTFYSGLNEIYRIWV
jgi:hypothetical protein